jgi:hypothetical protein
VCVVGIVGKRSDLALHLALSSWVLLSVPQGADDPFVGGMAMVSVLSLLRRASAEEDFSEARLARVAAALSDAGLPSSREFRLGFPPQHGERVAMAKGLACEVAAAIGNESASDIAVLLLEVAENVKELSVSACSSAASIQAVKPKRLLCGTLVEAESAADWMSSKVAQPSAPASFSGVPIARVPVGRLSFGLSAPPIARVGGHTGAASSVLRALGASTVEAKRPKVSCLRPAATLSAKEQTLLLRAKASALELLARAGNSSDVYHEMFGEDPNRSLEEAEAEVLFGVLFARLQPRVILGYIAEVNGYFSWLDGMGRSPTGVGLLMLCSYLRMSLSRGTSIPVKIRCSLNWFEAHAKIQLNSLSVGVRDFVSGLTIMDPNGTKIIKVKQQAPPLPVDIVRGVEGLVISAHTLPLRIMAGVVCLCVHGVKRWSDVQHVLQMTTTDDGLLVTTYKSKRKEFPLVWAALRMGFGLGEWVSPFVAALSEAGLPRDDFLVLRPTVDLQGFTDQPATWADANRCLHALLVLVGMEAEQAVRFTMHSCRHVYPTCAFQLLFPPAAVTLMGHWACKADRMATVYDGHKTSTELAYKANVCMNVRDGWRPVPDGEVPKQPLYPLGGIARPSVVATPPAAESHEESVLDADFQCVPLLREEHQGSEARGSVMSKYSLPEHIIQVFNTKTSTVHLSEGDGTACRAWRCGSPDDPVKTAEFATSSSRWTSDNPVNFCLSCHSVKVVSRLGGALIVHGEALEPSESSASESSSSSSSDDD